MVYDGAMYVFGGEAASTNKSASVFNDLYRFEFESRTWTLVGRGSTTSQSKKHLCIVLFCYFFYCWLTCYLGEWSSGDGWPEPRTKHTAVVIGDRMVVYGKYFSHRTIHLMFSYCEADSHKSAMCGAK